MNNPVVVVLLLGLLLLMIVSPFSALALLMLFAVASILGSMIWTIVRATFPSQDHS
jgi:predicted lipid-binding transport protein (Tim44 family)